MRTIVLSLGGSLIVPDSIDTGFLKKFRKLVLSFIEKGDRFIICCGGGKVCRRYLEAAEKIAEISQKDGDWIGIQSTKLNAELVRATFSSHAYEKVIAHPSEKIETDKKIIIGAGFEPGHSSDMGAVLLAENFDSGTVINMSNIDMVYEKDPNKNPDAKPLPEIGWDGFLDIIGEEWIPGRNTPFDPVASRKAQKLGLNVIVLNGKDLDNLKNCIEGNGFTGTVIG